MLTLKYESLMIIVSERNAKFLLESRKKISTGTPRIKISKEREPTNEELSRIEEEERRGDL